METKTPIASQKKKNKLIWFSIGTLALGTLTFLGIKQLKKSKTQQEHEDSTNENETTLTMDFENNPKNNTKPTRNTTLPSHSGTSSFPIKIGDKGDTIFKLQRALIQSNGTAIFKKYGADGKFGNELATYLRGKGYTIPLSETDYRALTKEKKDVSTSSTTNQTQITTLTAFNPTAIAYALYTAITGNDFLSAITLLKGITTTNHYALASEEFKKYRINGVRQTIVNALFNCFKNINQKIVIQNALQKTGLKYDGEKWIL